jgi:hypothetical protein
MHVIRHDRTGTDYPSSKGGGFLYLLPYRGRRVRDTFCAG